MMNKIIITILLAVDIILCFLCVWAFGIRANYNPNDKANEPVKIGILENNIIQGLNNNSFVLNDNLEVFDMESKTHQLREIIGDSTKLIVRFADTNCEECLRFVIVKLLRLTQEKSWDRNNILFLAFYENMRNLKIIKDKLHLDFPVYLSGNLSIPAESMNYPYCFTIDKSMQINHLFVPDKFEGRYSNTYFDIIHKRYFFQSKMIQE